MSRKTPILLRPSPLVPGVVYAITRYTRSGDTIKASAKEDVTKDFEACAKYLGWTPPFGVVETKGGDSQ